MRPRVTFCPQQIRKLRYELESSQEKVADLTMQLSANVRMTLRLGPFDFDLFSFENDNNSSSTFTRCLSWLTAH